MAWLPVDLPCSLPSHPKQAFSTLLYLVHSLRQMPLSLMWHVWLKWPEAIALNVAGLKQSGVKHVFHA